MHGIFVFFYSLMSAKNYFNHLKGLILQHLHIFRPYRAYFWSLVFSTNINAALPLKKAAEQQNICRKKITWIPFSCRAAKYLLYKNFDVLPNNNVILFPILCKIT